jgi:uncharacterized protein YcbX
MPVQLTQVFLYPVKSLRGFAVSSARIDDLGLVGDRRFLVVDEAGVFLTQRSHPIMATIGTALEANHLRLTCEGFGEIRVSLLQDAGSPVQTTPVSIWQSPGLVAEHCGKAVADWLTAILRQPVRLVRTGPAFRRPIPDRKLPAGLRRTTDAASQAPSNRAVAFPDAYPFMLLSESTLAELNARLRELGQAAMPMERFRPSFVLSGTEAYAEDRWGRFSIGGMPFWAGGPCARCIVTNTDPWTGSRGIEPLRLLSTYRRDPAQPSRINFGQNAVHDGNPGQIRVGDSVELLESEA